MTKKFNVLGNEIQFSDQMERYNELRQRYREMAEELSQQYITFYKKQNKNLDDVSKNGFQQGFQFIYKAIESSTAELVTNYKIFTIDEESFYNNFFLKYYSWDDTFSEIDDQYLEIILDSNQIDEHRQQRLQSRGRVVGGGFGVGGALKGMATAGAMNMASGATHMVFNGVAKTFTAIGNSSKKSKIFNNPSTLETLANSIYVNVINMHLAIIDAVKHYKNENVFDYITKTEAKEAELIFSNLSKGRIPKEDVGTLISDIFVKNPYPEKYYLYVLKQYGDEGGGLSKMADFFGIKLSKHKKALLEENFIEPSEIRTVKEADTYIEKMKDLAITLGFKDAEQSLAKYYKHREELDLQERTVDGIVFETKEEVTQAKAELEKIHSIIKVNSNTEEHVFIEALKQLNDLTWQTAIPDRYKKRLEKTIRKFDLEARTVDGTEYTTREEAQKNRQAVEQVEQLKEEADLKSLKGIAVAIKAVENSGILPKVSQSYITYLLSKQVQLEKSSREIEAIHAIIGDIESISTKQLKKQLAEVKLQNLETIEAKEEIEKITQKLQSAKKKPSSNTNNQVSASSNETEKPVKKSKGKVIGGIVALVVVSFIGFLMIVGSSSTDEPDSVNSKDPQGLEVVQSDDEDPINEVEVKTEEKVATSEDKSTEAEVEVSQVESTPADLDTVPVVGSNNTEESARDQISYLVYYYLEAYTAGDTSSLEYYVYPSSSFYSEQEDYMNSLHSRGIVLEVIDYSILALEQTAANIYEVAVEEYYTIDNPEKGFSDTSQISNYTVELIDGEFYITALAI